ncbi:MAG: hypothetical protein IT337_06510 [Thermomicrobiales bacterium]|nr:hypothetical protein [Thermomicrobiales bacterium]
MSDDLRERIALAIARVPAGKAADAVLDAIAETAVIVERGRFERIRRVAIAARYQATMSIDYEAISWQFPELTAAALSVEPGDLEPLP